MADLKPKWCSYCRKSDHDDSECYCTRVVGWEHMRPAPVLSDVIRMVAEKYSSPTLHGLLGPNDCKVTL